MLTIVHFCNTIDIDECGGEIPCEYGCSNSPGSYECTCKEGFELNTNGYNCTGSYLCHSSIFIDYGDIYGNVCTCV